MNNLDVEVEIKKQIISEIGTREKKIYLSLPHRLYMTDEQSRLYERATAGNRKYKDGIDSPILKLIKNHIEILSDGIGGAINFIDLGPGYPLKSLSIIDHLIARGDRLTYYAVDVSPYFLDRALSSAQQRGVPSVRLQRKFEEIPEILDRQLSTPTPRYIFLGLTFNNFDTRSIVKILSDITRQGDICLVCHQPGDKLSASDLTEPYRNDAVRDFSFSPLKMVGFDVGDFDFSPKVENFTIETTFVTRRVIRWNDQLIDKDVKFVTAISNRQPKAIVEDIIGDMMEIVGSYSDDRSGISVLKLTGLS